MKNSKLLKQSQRRFALGLILGILVAFFLALLPREKDTKITLIGGLPPYGEVWLTGIEINGAQSNLDDYPLGGKWKKIEESIVYVPDAAADGDELELDIKKGIITNLTNGTIIQIEPLPPVMIKLLNDGGLVEHIKKNGDFKLTD